MVQRQDRVARNREEKAKHWARVREQQPFAFLEKNEDRSIYQGDPGAGRRRRRRPAVPNKMDDLCNKIICQILVDDFLPNPKPDGDADSRPRRGGSRAKKFLRADGTTTGTDDRSSSATRSTTTSPPRRTSRSCWVDRPAAAGARSRSWRTRAPRTRRSRSTRRWPTRRAADPDGGRADHGEGIEPVLRYVAEVPNPANPKAPRRGSSRERGRGGAAVAPEASAQAAQHQPGALRPAVGHRVRRVVRSRSSCTTRSARRRSASRCRTLDQATLATCVSGASRAGGRRSCPRRTARRTPTAAARHRRHARLLVRALLPHQPDYQDGGQVCVNGAGGRRVRAPPRHAARGRRARRREDRADPHGSAGDAVHRERRRHRGRRSVRHGAARAFGGGKEAWDHIWVGCSTRCTRRSTRTSFIPGTSTVTKEDINRRDGTPIEILTKDDKPESRSRPAPRLRARHARAARAGTLNSRPARTRRRTGSTRLLAVGRRERHRDQEARVALAQYWQNTVKGLTHYWRIKTQLAQAKLTVPQMVQALRRRVRVQAAVVRRLRPVRRLRDRARAGVGHDDDADREGAASGFLQTKQWLDPEQAGELARSSMRTTSGSRPTSTRKRSTARSARGRKARRPGWVAEQQAAAQAQATAQQQGAAQQDTAKTQDADAERQFKAQEAARDREMELETQARTAMASSAHSPHRGASPALASA
jgi:hypothetical protein